MLLFFLFSIISSDAYSSISKEFDREFIKQETYYGFKQDLLKALCYVESNLKADIKVILDKNRPSYGICQVQLRTARHMGFKGTPKELMVPSMNIHIAAKYLNYNLIKHNGHWKKAVTAYNRGKFTNKMRENNSYVIRILLILNELEN